MAGKYCPELTDITRSFCNIFKEFTSARMSFLEKKERMEAAEECLTNAMIAAELEMIYFGGLHIVLHDKRCLCVEQDREND